MQISIAHALLAGANLAEMEIREIRLARLQVLLQQHGGSKKSLASAIKKAPAQVSQWFTHVRTITEDTARHIETTLGLPHLWLDQPLSTEYNTGPVIQPLRVAEELPPRWPFDGVSPAQFFSLPSHEQSKVQDFCRFIVSEWENAQRHRAAVR